MSLIADALKAAETERGSGTGRAREAALQILRTDHRRPPIQGTAEWLQRPVRFPRHVQIAGGIVGSAALVAIAIVLMRPVADADPAISDTFSMPIGISQLASTSTSVFPLVESAAVAAAVDLDAPVIVSDVPQFGANPGVAADLTASSVRTADPVANSGTAERSANRPPVGAGAGTTATPSSAAGTATLSGPAAAIQTPALNVPVVQERRQLSSQELRVNARQRANGDLFNEAVTAQRTWDYTRAIILYQEILALNPNDAEVLNNLGVSFQATGRLEAAKGAFESALEVQPGYAAAWSNLGVVLGRLGRDADARTALAEAIRQDPTNLGTKVNLALLHQKQGLPTEAKRLLQEVLAADPGMAEAHFGIAGLFEAEGSYSAALRHYHLFISTGRSRFPQFEALVAERIAILEGRR